MQAHLPHFSLLDCLIDKGSDSADVAVSAELADDFSVLEHKDLRNGHDAVFLGKFRKMKVDRFLLHYLAAGDDPYKTAVLFGKVNAALNALAPICRKRFDCRDTDVFTDISFTEEKMKIDFGLGFSIRIGQIFGVLNTILFGALWILIRHKMRKTGEKIRAKFSKKEKKILADG